MCCHVLPCVVNMCCLVLPCVVMGGHVLSWVMSSMGDVMCCHGIVTGDVICHGYRVVMYCHG